MTRKTQPRSKARRPTRTSTALVFLLGGLAFVQTGCQRSTETAVTPQSNSTTVANLVTSGREQWATRRPAALLASLSQFEQATQLDPTSADAWAGVADASALIGLYSLVPPQNTMPRALDAAQKALQLNPDLGGTWASLGLVQYLYEWNFNDAEASFRKALELEPRNHHTRHWLAMMLSVLGRHTEAIQEIDAAAGLAPTSALLATKVGTIRAAAGQLDHAQRLLSEAHRRFPDFRMTLRELGFVDLRQQDFAAATEYFRAALRPANAAAQQELLDTEVWFDQGNAKTLGALVHALGRSGDVQAARRAFQVLETRRKAEYVPSMVIAHALLGLGQLDQAEQELERALTERDPGLVYLYTKAGYDVTPARRLSAIAERIGPLASFEAHSLGTESTRGQLLD